MSSITAATGSELKQSVNTFHNFTLYLRLPVDFEKKIHKRLTLIIEAIYAIDGGTLMIAAQEEKVFWIFYLVGQKQADSFQTLRYNEIHAEIEGWTWAPRST